MAKYLVQERCRLVDTNEYLDVGVIYEPEDRYVQTSRSFSAAIRSRWIVKISDEEAKKYEIMNDKAVAKVVNTNESDINKSKNLSGFVDDMKDSDAVDQVVGENDKIIEARDKRRKEVLKAARPILKDEVTAVESNDDIVESEMETTLDEVSSSDIVDEDLISDVVKKKSETMLNEVSSSNIVDEDLISDVVKKKSDVSSLKQQIKSKIRTRNISK